MASPAHVPMQDAAPPLDVADRIESSNGAPLSADVAPPVDAADDRDFRLDQPLSAGGKPNFREKQIKVLRSSPPSLFCCCLLAYLLSLLCCLSAAESFLYRTHDVTVSGRWFKYCLSFLCSLYAGSIICASLDCLVA